MRIEIRKTNELTINQLLKIMKERTKVFVVEQKSPYQEIDDIDDNAIHVMFWTEDSQLAAYARIFEKEDAVSFGRVLVQKEFRGKGLGKKLIESVLEEINRQFPEKTIKIAAQSYLIEFYSQYGFKQASDEYSEDGIKHINMIK